MTNPEGFYHWLKNMGFIRVPADVRDKMHMAWEASPKNPLPAYDLEKAARMIEDRIAAKFIGINEKELGEILSQCKK
jgi:hypothetical protein